MLKPKVKMKNTNKDTSDFKPSRLEFLSDGIFAVAMTLLAVELTVRVIPKLQAAEKVGGLLIEMWPRFLAFAISFIVLGIFWFSHYGIFRFINSSDSRFAWLNILFLMFISLVPFSTALIGQYHVYSKVATIFFGINAFLAMLMLNFIWLYAASNYRLISNQIEHRRIKRIRVNFIIICSVFLLAVLISLINPIGGIVLYIVMALFGIILQVIITR